MLPTPCARNRPTPLIPAIYPIPSDVSVQPGEVAERKLLYGLAFAGSLCLWVAHKPALNERINGAIKINEGFGKADCP